MIGTGSRPVSAIRPANTEMMASGPPARAPAAVSTWRTVMSAVTLRCTPSSASVRTTSAVLVPRVSVTGIFT